ncbi:twin transmembrane helix small protein [Poseidonocella sedimentorum]|uniref:Hypoxia induced protein conserved region n=1 Tax=Poseidonocella sedimentorum TaxID=871652 RepID=A0A1I6E9N7_9RHOB|nr:twin transmembrane helix small protein [Poseidonocella sedimentorum]SFR14444.1 Hypoxia induced protein conserved region [Poseidonocella sedimentorum]
MFSDPVFVILAIVMLGVVAILGMGIMNFGKGTPDAAKRSNKLMQLRIVAQAVAVLLILVFIMARGGN